MTEYATEQDADLRTVGRQLVLDLLDTYIWQMERQVRDYTALSEPVPAGHWRWADMDTSGYRAKTEQEKAEDRARAALRLVEAQGWLALARETRQRVESGTL